MRHAMMACHTGRTHWVLALVLAVGLVFSAGASAGSGHKGKTAKEVAEGQEADGKPTGKEVAQAKPVELVVRVSDAAGKPTSGVRVSVVIDDVEIEKRSDMSGQARFRDLPAGTARVQAVATGWNTSGRNVALDKEQVQVDFALTPRTPPSGGAASAHNGGRGSSKHPAEKGDAAAAAEVSPSRHIQTAEEDLPAPQPSRSQDSGGEAASHGQGAVADDSR